MPSLRYKVDPRDVAPEKAARRLGLSLERFRELLPALLRRGFPAADPDTGNFDLDAIDAWRRRRHPHLFTDSGQGLTAGPVAVNPADVFEQRMAARRNG